MEFMSCNNIFGALCFNDKRLVYCTLGNSSNKKLYAALDNDYKGTPIEWDKFLDRIEADRESFRQGKVIESCEGCLMLSKKDWDKDVEIRKFNYILLSPWSDCNCGCCYCGNPKKSKLTNDIEKNSEINVNDTYDIEPIIKEMIDRNILMENATVDIAGGEPTMYYKINEVLRLLLDAKIKKIIIHTNAILYNELIAEAISRGIADICVSIDAGTERIHKKVKTVPVYKRVMENFGKYCKAKNSQYDNIVSSKYIIIPGINDNKDEIKKWMKNSRNLGADRLILNGDDNIFKENPINDKKIKKIVDLSEFFIKEAEKNNDKYALYPNIQCAYKYINKPLLKWD